MEKSGEKLSERTKFGHAFNAFKEGNYNNFVYMQNICMQLENQQNLYTTDSGLHISPRLLAHFDLNNPKVQSTIGATKDIVAEAKKLQASRQVAPITDFEKFYLDQLTINTQKLFKSFAQMIKFQGQGHNFTAEEVNKFIDSYKEGDFANATLDLSSFKEISTKGNFLSSLFKIKISEEQANTYNTNSFRPFIKIFDECDPKIFQNTPNWISEEVEKYRAQKAQSSSSYVSSTDKQDTTKSWVERANKSEQDQSRGIH